MGRRWPNPRQTGVHVSSRTRWSSSLVTGTAKKGRFGERSSVPWEGGASPSATYRGKKRVRWPESVVTVHYGAAGAAPPLPPHTRLGGGEQASPPFVWRCRRQAGQMRRCFATRFPFPPRSPLPWEATSHRSFHFAPPFVLATCSPKVCAPDFPQGFHSPPPHPTEGAGNPARSAEAGGCTGAVGTAGGAAGFGGRGGGRE